MKSFNPEMFQARLKEQVENKHESQRKISKSLHMDHSTLSRYLSKANVYHPSVDTLIVLADYFGVTTDYLLGLSDCPSVEIDTQQASKTTGLSSEAITLINSLTYSSQELRLGSFYEQYYLNWTKPEISDFLNNENSASFISLALSDESYFPKIIEYLRYFVRCYVLANTFPKIHRSINVITNTKFLLGFDEINEEKNKYSYYLSKSIIDLAASVSKKVIQLLNLNSIDGIKSAMLEVEEPNDEVEIPDYISDYLSD